MAGISKRGEITFTWSGYATARNYLSVRRGTLILLKIVVFEKGLNSPSQMHFIHPWVTLKNAHPEKWLTYLLIRRYNRFAVLACLRSVRNCSRSRAFVFQSVIPALMADASTFLSANTLGFITLYVSVKNEGLIKMILKLLYQLPLTAYYY